MKLTSLIALHLVLLTFSFAQSGPPFEITQSVIANGGGKSDGGPFSITGTIAQPISGTTSSNSPYAATGGFWQSFLVPTAAGVSLRGRVTSAYGQPISLAFVIVEDGSGLRRIVRTNTFGLFKFSDLEPGRTYIVSGSHRRYRFAPRVISLVENLDGLIISANR